MNAVFLIHSYNKLILTRLKFLILIKFLMETNFSGDIKIVRVNSDEKGWQDQHIVVTNDFDTGQRNPINKFSDLIINFIYMDLTFFILHEKDKLHH